MMIFYQVSNQVSHKYYYYTNSSPPPVPVVLMVVYDAELTITPCALAERVH